MAEKLVTQEELEVRVKGEIEKQRLTSHLTIHLVFMIVMSILEFIAFVITPSSGFDGVFRGILFAGLLFGMYCAFQAGYDIARIKDLSAERERLKGKEEIPISTSS